MTASFTQWQLSNVAQANAGDSRSVLGVKGRAKPLSYDHKPQNEGESHIAFLLAALAYFYTRGESKNMCRRRIR